MARIMLIALLFLSLGSGLRAQEMVDQRVSILRAAAKHAARVASDESGQFVSIYDVHPSSEAEEDGPALLALAAELGRSVATSADIVKCESRSVCRSVDGSRAGFTLSDVKLQGSQGSATLVTWFLSGQTGSLELGGRVDQVHLVGSDAVWSVADFRTTTQY